ncbi:GSCOCG00007138001-RA-CDS [Cotesia congregata]|uniref:Methionine aminopeptidase n=1 Tax=Cotesia congregata TaxID=51543 RepID=A0A8J2MLQ4_COTCN|nr:GSCOCG00007138001-RA-CDS [Cotesia congregata]CAG5092889.1 Similar to METAP1D: Methionine aminopeptidase 1D [Cotesia congregata]
MLKKTLMFNRPPIRNFFKGVLEKINPFKKTVYKPIIIDNEFGKYEIVLPQEVSMKKKKIPKHIRLPKYASSTYGMPEHVDMEFVEIKNNQQIECMRQSCALARKILNSVGPLIKEGVTTEFLDDAVFEMIISNGAYPSPLNYLRFPKSICTSVNNVACHGIPDNRPLRNGDILNVDITVFLNGYHGDCSTMFAVGEIDNHAKKLIDTTKNCLDAAINICKPSEDFRTIGATIEKLANENGFTVVPSFCGHGIGTYFHGPPDIYHFANDFPGKMAPGMTFTIEPLLTQGKKDIAILEDSWTAVMVDFARTAQFEHTILITEDGCEILTL